MIISLENVSVGYDKKHMILKDISTSFSSGGICGILGPNGSGKTTLLRTLSGILPYLGNIKLVPEKPDTDNAIEIKNSSHKEIAKYIAVTPQMSSVYFSYSVFDTVLMGRYAQSTSFLDSIKTVSTSDKEKVEYYLEMTGISDISEKQISDLSGGQLQRVFLARTFAQETPIILLDEPTNHLDIKYHIELMEHIKKWSSEATEINGISHNNTAIVVFHDICDAATVSDSMLLMKDGNIIKKGATEDILNGDLINSVFDTNVKDYYLSSVKIFS